MPFIFIVPVWLLIVLAATPLLFVRKLRFLAVHIVMASTMAILISFSLAISVLVAGGRLPVSRLNGFPDIWLFRTLARRRRPARTGARHLPGTPHQHPPRVVAGSGFVTSGSVPPFLER